MLVIDDGRAFGFGGGLGSRFGGRHVVNPEALSLAATRTVRTQNSLLLLTLNYVCPSPPLALKVQSYDEGTTQKRVGAGRA